VSAESVAGAPSAGRKFPSSARLLKHSDFERVYHNGSRQFSGNLTVFYMQRQQENAPGPRVGFTVSRALGGAVERNRIRRRLREAVRTCLPHLRAPLDVVINPKKAVRNMEFAALLAELRRAFDAVQKKSSGR
jgi:ribonuclease P protein component